MARKFSIAAVLSIVCLAGLFFVMRGGPSPEDGGIASTGIPELPPAEDDAVGSEPDALATSDGEIAPASEEDTPTPVRHELVRGKWLLTGRVVTRETRDGLPDQLVPAARVKIYFKHHPNRNTPEEAPPPQTSITGPDGRFAVVGVPGRLWLRLEVDAETYAYRTLSFKLADPEWKGHKDLGDILIEKGRDIRVRVIGPEEEPVLGAEVLVGREKNQRSLSLENAGIKESRRLATEVGEGLYEVERGPPGTIRVQVRAAGYSRFREYVEVPEDGPVVIRMKEGLEVTGVVKSAAGAPIEGAVLEIDGPNIGSPLPTTTSDAEGMFVFDILSSGEHEIKATADGFAALRMKEITAGIDTVELLLEKEAVLAGTVVAEDDGAPVKGAVVNLRNTTANDSFDATTDGRGAFEMKGLSGGSYTVSVDHDDYAIFHEVEVEIETGESITDQVLRLGRGLVVAGAVLDVDTNEPVPEALVAFRYSNSSSGSSGISLTKEGETAADGSYTLSGFIEGGYSAAAKAEDYLSETSRRVTVGEGVKNEVVFTLKRGGDISGRVLNSAGYPVPGVSVDLFAMPSPPATPGGALEGATRLMRGLSSRGVSMAGFSGSGLPTGGGGKVKSVVSDESGRYALRGIPPGTSYGLVAAHRDFTSTLLEGIAVGDRESLRDVDITLSKGGIIRGRILDENGAGVAGAKVRASFQPPAVDPEDPSAATPGAPPTGMKIQMVGRGAESVYSGAGGEYLLTRLTIGTYTVSADLEGRLPATRENVEVGEEAVVDAVDIVLTRGETLAGVVVDDQGEPIPGAEIRASGGGSPRATTDLEGAFQLEGLPADKVSARISKTGYVTEQQEFTPPEKDVVITLRVAATVIGTVVFQGSGEPVSGANVNLRPAADPGQPGAPSQFRGGVPGGQTRSDGTFTLREVPPGDYQLFVDHNEYSPATLPVSAIASGETREVTVELGAGGVVRGLVTGGGGPVVNAEIRVYGSTPGGGGNVSKSVRTDANGAFSVKGLPTGEYTVRARPSSRSAQLFMPTQRQITAVEGQVTELAFDLELAVRVQGMVLSAGQPIGRGGITALDLERNRPVGNGSIDNSGSYQIDVPGPGLYVFQINFQGASGGRVEIEVPSGRSSFTRDIELPAGSIAGVVVDAATGEPVPRARVMAVQSGTELRSISSLVSAMQSSAGTDDSGRFVLGFLTPGTYSIQVTASGYAQAQQGGIQIGGRNPTGEVSVQLQRGAAFQALVQTPRGEPVSGAFGILRDAAGSLLQLARPAVSDQNGIMNITGLLPGTYSVSVIHPSYAPARYEIGVDEGAPQGVFTVERGGKVRLQVVDRSGAAVAGAKIEIIDEGGQDILEDTSFLNFGGGGPSNRTDGQGAVEIDRVPAGSYRVRATKDGERSPPEKIDVTTDGTAEHRLTLR